MKKCIFIILFLAGSIPALALHIAGGEMYYRYLGPGSAPNTDRYLITLRLFRECNPAVPSFPPNVQAAPMPADVAIGIFSNGPPVSLMDSIDVKQSDFKIIELQSPLICINNPPSICYQVGYFTFTIDLPKVPNGYTIAYQTCCRSFLLNNIVFYNIPGQSSGEGATYSCQIPGTALVGNQPISSPVFALKDTTLVCQDKKFSLDFSASDSLNATGTGAGSVDSVSYSFCAAYNRGKAASSLNIIPSFPPYQDVTYRPGFSGIEPLGPNAVINPRTGIISGIAPTSGGYVVSVCVQQWHHAIPISIHRKDFILRIAACDFAAALLNPAYLTCDGYGIQLQNESTSSAVHSYFWDFGVPGIAGDTSDSPTPQFIYRDTGTYTVKLVINRGETCSDSTTSQAKIYPGFFPGFKISGSCFLDPFQFTDTTVTKYGTVNSWFWKFGDNANPGDTSHLKDPVYHYAAPADSTAITFIVSNSKGCTDTLGKKINVIGKPAIQLPFRDTLICITDSLQLFASSPDSVAVFSWSPGYAITSQGSPDPLVFPKDTTTYQVTASDKGCTSSDSVKVNVIQSVTLFTGNDTTICKTDSIQFHPRTNGLYFSWIPTTALNNPALEDPEAAPAQTTTYTLTSSVGRCSSTDSVRIKVVPYPVVYIGPDTVICYGAQAYLHSRITGSSFYWSPTNSLLDPRSLSPVAGPESTTEYILTTLDTLGCPKPVSDSVLVTVLPQLHIFAGNDTTIVADQPLQLNAQGGLIYHWYPATGMNDPSSKNPVVVLGASYDSVTYYVRGENSEGCFGTDSLKVKLFKIKPDLLIPTAFTPNGDGRNDVFKPVLAGIRELLFFRVYNRWGEMLYSTSQPGQGWDGNFAGSKQNPGTYVFMAEAIDYLGNRIFKKGTFVLIR